MLALGGEKKSAGFCGRGGRREAGLGLWARGIAVALVMGTGAGAARAHDWYPYECCSNRDCYPVPASRVQVVPGGWIIDGIAVRHGEARPSPDGRFHICRHQDGKGDLIRPQGQPTCAWAPVEGS